MRKIAKLNNRSFLKMIICIGVHLFGLISQVNAQFHSIAEKDFLKDNRDGNIYRIIRLNNQWWFAEDLRYRIPRSMVFYDQTNDKQVRYYPWDILMDKQSKVGKKGLCPEGWRIPSVTEWESLINTYGGYTRAGTELKDVLSGLNIHFTVDQKGNRMMRRGKGAWYWSSTKAKPTYDQVSAIIDSQKEYAYSFYFSTEDANIYSEKSSTAELFKCRCIKSE